MLSTSSFGAKQVILPEFNANAVLRAIAEYRVTHLYLPPTALYGLIESPELGRQEMSSLKIFLLVLLVGSPVSPEKLRLAVEKSGLACARPVARSNRL